MVLQRLKYQPLTTGELKPVGWLKRQLEIQAEGLSGHLDLIWPSIRDSKWIGGTDDGWERVPYWLDGFIPMAWLLDRADLKDRADRYITAILKGQQEDGWICPCEREERAHYDVWAAFLICKVLVVYYECTQDVRIEEAVYRAMKNLHRHIQGNTLFNWGSARWFECLIPLYWLMERRSEKWMETMCHELAVEGIDYKGLFANWCFEQPDEHGRWNYLTHVVNLAMALKSEALFSRITDTDGSAFARNALTRLLKDHGMANGHFTGDECLSGTSPIQGTECCGVVEAMYSYEHLIQITGEGYWSDMLEKLAYNALPATTSADMWTHQYDQMTNQVECSYIEQPHVPFRTNSGESHLFGLEPNFGCCTANFNQGWPKFALSAVMRTSKGLAVTAIAPVRVETYVQEVPVTLEVMTLYPFRSEYRVKVTAASAVVMELELRIPSWAGKVSVEWGEEENCSDITAKLTDSADGKAILRHEWNGTQTVTVRMDFETKMVKRPGDMYCVERGPLLYALKLEEKRVPHEFTKNGVERKAPYCDYEIFAQSPWNYAFVSEKQSFEVTEHKMVNNTVKDDSPGNNPADTYLTGCFPFDTANPPISLRTQLVPIPWQMEHGVCREQPDSRIAIGAPETRIFVPYGCTDIRMTQMPVVAAVNDIY